MLLPWTGCHCTGVNRSVNKSWRPILSPDEVLLTEILPRQGLRTRTNFYSESSCVGERVVTDMSRVGAG